MHDCADADARISRLEAEVAELKALLRKLSTPDIVKPDSASKKRKKRRKPGALEGHEARNRPAPASVDETVAATAAECPDCDQALGSPTEVRERTVEDIVPGRVIVKRLREARYWCTSCKAHVQARAPDALPGEHFGIHLMLLVAFLNAGGMSFRKVQDTLRTSYALHISLGATVGLRDRLARALGDEYERLRLELQASASVNADETSWPVNGTNHWLWGFLTPKAAWFTVNRSRGAAVVINTLEDYDGVLTSDFWAGYNTPLYRKQKCLVHLQRELHEVSDRHKTKRQTEWWSFRKKLTRLVRDAVRAHERITIAKEREAAAARFDARASALTSAEYADKDARRIAKLLKKHAGELFTFLRHPGVEWHNNRAERGLRPSVVTRKSSFGSRSTEGAQASAILQSIIQTTRLRGENFLRAAPDMIGLQRQAAVPEG